MTPSWVGQSIFNLSNPLLDNTLPYAEFDEIPNGKVNIILRGYFQFQEAINFLSKTKLKSWFSIQEKWKQKFKTHLPVVAHLRRGDYLDLASIFCLVSEASYLNACKEFHLDVSKLTWIKNDSSKNQDIPFLEDFILLMNASILLRANSSFSWWAGTLGNGRVFSPLVENRVGMQDVSFVEGNWPRMVDGCNCRSNITDLYLNE